MDAETADGARHYSSHMCKLLAWQRIHRGDTSRNFYALPAVVQKQDAIGWQSFLGPLAGAGVKQHRYYEFLDSRRTGLVDCSYPEIMGCSMGHGWPQPYTTRPGEGWVRLFLY
jgi:hypothetical protein